VCSLRQALDKENQLNVALGSKQLQKSAPQENYFKFLLTVSNCEECLFIFLVPPFFIYLFIYFCVIVVRIATFNPEVQRWIFSNSPSFFFLTKECSLWATSSQEAKDF
jgi:hypothetical protein